MKFKGGVDAVVGQEEVVSDHIDEKEAFGLALHVSIFLLGVHMSHAAAVVID